MRWQKLPDPSPEYMARRRRTKRTKFLTDENLGSGVIEFFQWYRMNAVTVWDVGLAGRDDTLVFAYAWRHRRVLLTHDEDFWDDRRFPEHRNPGLAILPGANGDQSDMVRGLVWMKWLMDRDPEQWQKQKVRITRDGDVFIKLRHWRTGAMATSHYRFTRKGAMEWA
jgi:hypothetical protein